MRNRLAKVSWAGVSPVDVEIVCGEAWHRISWRDGRLHFHDHDVTAEELAAVMGANPPTCIAILFAWRRHRTSVLHLRPRVPDFRLAAAPIATEQLWQSNLAEAENKVAWLESVGPLAQRALLAGAAHRAQVLKELENSNSLIARWRRYRIRKVDRAQSNQLPRVPTWVETEKRRALEDVDAKLLASLPEALLARYEMGVAVKQKRARTHKAQRLKPMTDGAVDGRG